MSPRARARLAGLFEALEGFPAAFGQVVVIGMVASSGDAAATAHDILANENLYRLGFLIPLAAVGFHIVWALLMYQLFVPVNRTIALLATFVILVGCAIQAAAALVYLAPLVILQTGSSLSGFDTSQQQSLALVFVNLSSATFQVYLIFFGLWCVLTGYLIFRSTFLPRILGVLLVLDGLAWMTFLWPPFATSIYPAIETVSALAEIPLLLWFVIFGVNNQKWNEQARGKNVASQNPDAAQQQLGLLPGSASGAPA